MRITVIGTINKDLILPFNDVPIESFGGIFYDIAVLSELLGPDDRIFPVSYVGEDVAPTLQVVLEKHPNVITDGLTTLPQKHHKVILEYQSPQRREEKSLFPFPPLDWKQIEPFLDSDMIIVNLISGWDLQLEAFKKLSRKFRERLYLDVHYLVMGTDNLGRRFPSPPPEVATWMAGARFVQMNESEFRLLSNESRNAVDFFTQFFKSDQMLLITRGAGGAEMVYKRDKMVGQKKFPACKLPRLIDATGCGDAFGSAFTVKYLQTGDTGEAMGFANLVAGANACLRGTNEMHRLLETMEVLRRINQPRRPRDE